MICYRDGQSSEMNRTIDNLQSAIHVIRGQRVMLDSDLAEIYRVTTRHLNQQLKRNHRRFPIDFAFQLRAEEFTNLKSQIVTSSSHGGKRKLPWVFTEHGAIMLRSGTQVSSLCGTRTFCLRALIQQQAESPLAAQPTWLCSVRSARYKTKKRI